jgi:hypothetical protein
MLIDSGGASKKMAEIMRSSLINRLKSLGSAALEVGFQIFDAFDEKGAKAIDSFTRVLRGVNLKPILDDLVSFSERLAELTAKTELFVQFGKTFDAFSATLKTTGEALGFFTDLFPELPTQFKILDALLAPITAKLKNMELALKGINFLIQNMGVVGAEIKSATLTGRTVAENAAIAAGATEAASPAATRQAFSGTERLAPTRRENLQQAINFSGQLNIAGAPPGSTFEQEKGPPLIDVSFSAAPAGL